MERVERWRWHQAEQSAAAGDLAALRRWLSDPVLELAAGAGRLAGALTADGYTVTGVETDPVLIDELAANCAEVVVTSATELPFSGEFGSVVIADGSLGLFGPGDRAGVFAGCRRALRPGGRLLAVVLDTMVEHDGESPGLVVVHGGVVYTAIGCGCILRDGRYELRWRYEARDQTSGELLATHERSESVWRLTSADVEREVVAAGFMLVEVENLNLDLRSGAKLCVAE